MCVICNCKINMARWQLTCHVVNDRLSIFLTHIILYSIHLLVVFTHESINVDGITLLVTLNPGSLEYEYPVIWFPTIHLAPTLQATLCTAIWVYPTWDKDKDHLIFHGVKVRIMPNFFYLEGGSLGKAFVLHKFLSKLTQCCRLKNGHPEISGPNPWNLRSLT